MSSPIHHAEDLDEALHYAPPVGTRAGTTGAAAARCRIGPIAAEPGRRIGVADDAFSGDRAMVTLQRQLALDPDAVPVLVDDIQSLWPMALRLCAVAGVAAAVAWLVHRCRVRGSCDTTSCAQAFNRRRPSRIR